MRKIGNSGERRTRPSVLDVARARKQRLAAAAVVATLSCARVERPPPEPVHPAEAHREATAEARARIPGAQVIAEVGDTAVVALTGQAFARLSREERLQGYWIAQAAKAGDAIALDQGYRHNLEVVRLLRGILQRPEVQPPEALEKLRHYARRIYLARGMHDPLTGQKLAPLFSSTELRAAALAAQAGGADLGLRGARLDAVLRALEGPIFDPRLDALRTARPAGDDALSASAVNLYSGVSLRDLGGFAELHADNSQLVKESGRLFERVYRASAGGLYASELERAAAALDQAASLASGLEREWLQKRAQALRSGESEDFRAAEAAHARSEGPLDAALGFLAREADPRGVKGLWLGEVGVLDPERTSKLSALAGAFLPLERETPWPDEYKRREPAAAIPRALWLAAAAGPARPEAMVGLRDGPVALLFSEIDDAAATARDLRETQELAPPGSAAELLRCRAQVRLALIALREVIGRGSGAPPAVPVPLELQEHAAVLEEARAELVAHWHATGPRMAGLHLLEDDRCQQSWPELAGLSWIESLARVDSGDRLDSAHLRATQLMLWWFTQRKALAPRAADGKTYLVAGEPALFRKAAGSLLSLLQIIRATGDAALLRGLIEAHASRLDPALRDEVKARLIKEGIPRRVAVLPPRLVPVLENGVAADARASPASDLDEELMADWSAL